MDVIRQAGLEMDSPLVSIITPALNRADTIAESLDSVATQTYEPIELIVIDGGSTDGTIDILKRYRPPFPFRWISEPDQGMYDAINKGISLASGDVLAYLNSDDLYVPWSVEVAVEALRHEADLVYGDLGILRVEGQGPTDFYLQFYPDFNFRYYTYVGTLGQPTVFWRRELTERIGMFDIDYRLIGDCEYWLRAARSGANIEHVAEVLAIQVDHGSALRWTQWQKLHEEFAKLRDAMGTVVSPPSSQALERVKKSLIWRVRKVEFFFAMATQTPSKWPRFIGLLRKHGLNLSVYGLLASLLPARWRGHSGPFGDARRMREILTSANET